MSKARLEIIVSAEELPELFNRACIIIAKLRHFDSKRDAAGRERLKYWRGEADKLLSELNIQTIAEE